MSTFSWFFSPIKLGLIPIPININNIKKPRWNGCKRSIVNKKFRNPEEKL
jgi:hypothetical protein